MPVPDTRLASFNWTAGAGDERLLVRWGWGWDGSRGGTVGSNVVSEFEDYDRTPYGGGYEITQVYGRPLPPSEDICYPITRAAASTTGQPRPPAYGDWGQKPQESHAYGGASGGGFGISSHPQPQLAYGFHPQQEIAVDDGRISAGYGRGGQPKFDYGFRPGAPQPGGYEQRPSGLGSYGYTGSGPSRQEEASHGYGYGHGHQTGTVYPTAGYGSGRGHVEGSNPSGFGRPEHHGHGSGYMEQGYGSVSSFGRQPPSYGQEERSDPSGFGRPEHHGHGSGYMEQGYGPVSSFGRQPPSYGQEEQRQSSHEAYQGERFGSYKYGDDIRTEEKKHHHQKYRHHH